MLGTQEAIRQSQAKEKREEHRARRCNLIVTCVRSSGRSRDINGRQVVLRDSKLFIDTGINPSATEPFGHPFAGYYLPYPDAEYEGLVSTITNVAPILNWIYIDKDTYEVKYGVRDAAQPHLTGPFDCTRQDRRLTFEEWEGFVAVEEQPSLWAIYFDRDDDGLRDKVPQGKRVLEVTLTRWERKKEKGTDRDGSQKQEGDTTVDVSVKNTKKPVEPLQAEEEKLKQQGVLEEDKKPADVPLAENGGIGKEGNGHVPEPAPISTAAAADAEAGEQPPPPVLEPLEHQAPASRGPLADSRADEMHAAPVAHRTKQQATGSATTPADVGVREEKAVPIHQVPERQASAAEPIKLPQPVIKLTEDLEITTKPAEQHKPAPAEVSADAQAGETAPVPDAEVSEQEEPFVKLTEQLEPNERFTERETPAEAPAADKDAGKKAEAAAPQSSWEVESSVQFGEHQEPAAGAPPAAEKPAEDFLAPIEEQHETADAGSSVYSKAADEEEAPAPAVLSGSRLEDKPVEEPPRTPVAPAPQSKLRIDLGGAQAPSDAPAPEYYPGGGAVSSPTDPWGGASLWSDHEQRAQSVHGGPFVSFTPDSSIIDDDSGLLFGGGEDDSADVEQTPVRPAYQKAHSSPPPPADRAPAYAAASEHWKTTSRKVSQGPREKDNDDDDDDVFGSPVPRPGGVSVSQQPDRDEAAAASGENAEARAAGGEAASNMSTTTTLDAPLEQKTSATSTVYQKPFVEDFPDEDEEQRLAPFARSPIASF